MFHSDEPVYYYVGLSTSILQYVILPISFMQHPIQHQLCLSPVLSVFFNRIPVVPNAGPYLVLQGTPIKSASNYSK